MLPLHGCLLAVINLRHRASTATAKRVTSTAIVEITAIVILSMDPADVYIDKKEMMEGHNLFLIN